ncbi:MAG: SDR family NAD(P)-dependent oxidoreductase [Pseudomonadota bacterium]
MRALITGAAHGLGRAMTEQLLENGHEVVAVDLDVDALDNLAIRSRGACMVRMADMAKPESLDRLVRALAGSKFDLVVLNAGISAVGKFEDLPSQAQAKVVAVNFTGPMILSSMLVRESMMNRGGKMVFISSLSKAVGYPGASVYAATKDGIANYARNVRKPFKKRGVGILTVYPGPIRTDHAERYAPPGADAKKRMEPAKLANMILKAAASRKKELWPGMTAQMGLTMGWFSQGLATRAMRKAIYDKLEEPKL